MFDPTLPATNAALSSAVMRSQLTGLQTNIDNATTDKVTFGQLAANIAGTAVNPAYVQPLAVTFSNPPTDAELYQVQDKINELLTALYRTP